MLQLDLFGGSVRLKHTPSTLRGKSSVWQCTGCGACICIAGPDKPPGDCPGAHTIDRWSWTRQELPVSVFKEATGASEAWERALMDAAVCAWTIVAHVCALCCDGHPPILDGETFRHIGAPCDAAAVHAAVVSACWMDKGDYYTPETIVNEPGYDISWADPVT